VQSIHRGLTGSLGRGSGLLTSSPCGFTCYPQALAFFTKVFDRLTMEVAHLPRFFRESPEALRLSPGGFGILTSILSSLAHAFRLLAVLFLRKRIVRHVAPFPAAHPERISRAGRW
jgi:hypothetical protein